MTAGVRLAGIVKTYAGARALDGVDLDAAAGETLAILGPSGCGKTTLLRTVAGLDHPDTGSVHIDGRDVTTRPPGERNVAMVFQNHALLPHLSVAENIAFGLRARGRRRPDDVDRRVAEAAALAGCDHLLDRRPAHLSGGERQRVALARAVARQPAVLLLDEPLASLDAHLRSRVRLDLRQVFDGLGVTVLHVTHDQAEAQALGHRVAVVAAGRVHQVGTPDDVYDRPADRFVAGFLGIPPMNLFEVLDGDPPRAGPFCLVGPAVPGGRRLDAGIRPEAIRLGGAGEGTPGRVQAVDPTGADAIVTVEAAGCRVVALVPRHGRPVVGEEVRVVARPGAFHLFDRDTGAAWAHPGPP